MDKTSVQEISTSLGPSCHRREWIPKRNEVDGRHRRRVYRQRRERTANVRQLQGDHTQCNAVLLIVQQMSRLYNGSVALGHCAPEGISALDLSFYEHCTERVHGIQESKRYTQCKRRASKILKSLKK